MTCTSPPAGSGSGTALTAPRNGQAALTKAISDSAAFTVDLLYGDHEGGQRTISRFTVNRHSDGWLCGVVRHWNLDRHDPR